MTLWWKPWRDQGLSEGKKGDYGMSYFYLFWWSNQVTWLSLLDKSVMNPPYLYNGDSYTVKMHLCTEKTPCLCYGPSVQNYMLCYMQGSLCVCAQPMRQRYITSSPIGWVHTQNDPCRCNLWCPATAHQCQMTHCGPLQITGPLCE